MKLQITYKLLFFIILLSSCSKETNIDFEKYDTITTAKEISKFYEIPLDTTGNSESAKILKWIDGSFDFYYSYQLKESKKYTPMIYLVEIKKRNSINDAIEDFNNIKSQFIILSDILTDSNLKEINDLIPSNEQYYYAIRHFDNEPNGILFALRKQNIVYSLIVSGFYTNDHSLIKELILPELQNLEKFNIKD